MTDQHAVEGALSLAQKASLTSGASDFTTQDVPGVPSVRMSDGPHGLRLPKEQGDGGQTDLRSAAQTTCFPPAVALGSSWDPALAERVASAIAAEAQAFGVHVVLGPGINIKRSPLCGRNFEYFSEDPLLSAELGGAMVRGLQQSGVGAALKHYAANNQETDRMRVSADIDERPLREIYLRAFERIVRRERPWSVMASYNAVNGVPLCENGRLLTTVLRGEWGFDGVVMSDWGAVRDRVAALRAGLDLQMPGTKGRTDRDVRAAVEQGSLDAASLDEAVRRLGLFARRATEADATPASPADAQLFDVHHALAREAAERSIVLLKNEGELLPLDSSAGSIAVIGELARTPRFQGAGSSQVTPTRVDTPLEGLREFTRGATVEFVPGYALPGPQTPEATDEVMARQALQLAAHSDTVVLFLGLAAQDESEGFDRDHIDLPPQQMALLERLTAAHPRVVAVLSNGGVVRTAPWHEEVPALIEGWLLGQAAGSALARVLFGEVAPGGRLAETVPVRLEDSPSHLSFPGEEGHVRYGEGVFVGYRGHDARRGDVAFPFGHGLTYTTFAYDDLLVTWDKDGTALEITVTVTNTGGRAGREVVQVYVGGPDDSVVARPRRELRGFADAELAPGERQTVTVTVERADLSYYSEREGGWRVESGIYRVDAGASSRDIRRSVSVDIEGDPSQLPLSGRNTLAEWFAHPVGGPLLQKAFARGSDPDTGQVLAEPALRRFLAGVPLDVISEFPQSPVSPDDVPNLAARAREAHTDAAPDQPGA
ncbi:MULTISPECIES: glycoside hydrolase family 3 C-terminal domain-containing protein [unclassified Streptomyces]|uniref:glycoside hydrolase family 3 C-terminal domain-containing protein n=1 Tax=unclassified Streptomyces TaxID=2593676 RepID=UPI002E16E884|nr:MULTISPECIES: glycoside hydrolase family 3 C-terminal domain-containing protein [unclassified Streptomyces]